MGEKRKARFAMKLPEEVDYDDEEVKENLRASSSSNQKSLYEEIKKAYYKLALRLHPDKNPDDECLYAGGKEKFQQLQKVRSIIGDEEKRAVYDQTGCVDDADLVGDAIQNLQTFFRSIYKKLILKSLRQFIEADSEKKDLLKLFKECEGNMDRLFCCMLCSDAKLDSHRFKDIIDEAISAGKIESTKAYKRWAKQVSKTEPPGPLRLRKKWKEISEYLYAIIAQRQNERRSKVDSVFSNLVHKYDGRSCSRTE